MNTRSQAGQDIFVLNVLKNKQNGIFLEIGSGDPEYTSNTYILDKLYNWTGIMVEHSYNFLPLYKLVRPKSLHIMEDATTVNFKNEFEMLEFPNIIDYLQIDLDVDNRSTLTVLENLDRDIMDNYKFRVVTFEHDIYRGDYFNTRTISRNIFEKRGYVRVFSDVKQLNSPFEDWYVYPDCVDMNYINNIRTDESIEGLDIIKRITI